MNPSIYSFDRLMIILTSPLWCVVEIRGNYFFLLWVHKCYANRFRGDQNAV